MITKEQVIKVMQEIDKQSQGRGYALCGGGLFVLEELEDYTTNDIDVIASKAWGVTSWEVKYHNENHWSSEWYYSIQGHKIDWVCEDHTRKNLHDSIIQDRIMHPAGFYVAPMSYAFALRLAVGRPKDVEFVEQYRHWVKPALVNDILEQHNLAPSF